MNKVIVIKDKARFCSMCAKHLSDFLNTNIGFNEVLDELSLYEWGMRPKNEILSAYVIKFLKTNTTENQKPTKK